MKWLAAVHRGSDVNPNHAGVCERHFKPDDFVTASTKRTQKKRVRKSLKPGVVPSVFPDYPTFALPRMELPRVTSRATSSARREAQAELAEHRAQDFMEAQEIQNLDELLKMIAKERLPSGYRYFHVLI